MPITGALLCVAFFFQFFGTAIFHLTREELRYCGLVEFALVLALFFGIDRLLDHPFLRRFLSRDFTIRYVDECKIRNFQPYEETPERVRMFGLIDLSGNWYGEKRYEYLSGFREGVAIANHRYLLGKDGSERQIFQTPDRMSLYHQFNEGMAPFCQYSDRNQEWGFVALSGERVIRAHFSHVRSFHAGLAAVEFKGKWGYIDPRGNFVIPPTYVGAHFPAHDFRCGLAVAFNGEAWGYIDQRGEWAIPARFSQADDFFEELAFVQENDKYGFIDLNGTLVIDLGPCPGKRFSGGLARFQDHDRWGFIDRTGKCVIEPTYRQARDFAEGVAAVQWMNHENLFIDGTGRAAVPGVFAEAKPFSQGVAPVRRELEPWGFINHSGKQVIDPRFEFAEPFAEGFALVS